MLSYVILDDLVFPLRDFIEVLMFSYLFYVQSNKRKDLDQINEKWKKINRVNMRSFKTSDDAVSSHAKD
jgi:hypothetical protein